MQKITIIAIVAATAAAIGIIATTAPYVYSALNNVVVGAPEKGYQELITVGAIHSDTNNDNNGYRQINITVNGIELITDIAETDEQRTKGLSIKDALAENEAMLFIFDIESAHSFWMKDMKFPIDIIWLDSNKTVIHIEHNLEPCSLDIFCPTYKPDNNDTLHVLETVAGFAEKHDIIKGTIVEFQLQ